MANRDNESAQADSSFAAFLLARIEDDRALAQAVVDGRPSNGSIGDAAIHVSGLPAATYAHVLNFGPFRVLADCDARRQILEEHARRNFVTVASFTAVDSGATCSTCHAQNGDAVTWPCYTLRALASVHADHGDYCETWRP